MNANQNKQNNQSNQNNQKGQNNDAAISNADLDKVAGGVNDAAQQFQQILQQLSER